METDRLWDWAAIENMMLESSWTTMACLLERAQGILITFLDQMLSIHVVVCIVRWVRANIDQCGGKAIHSGNKAFLLNSPGALQRLVGVDVVYGLCGLFHADYIRAYFLSQ